MTLTVTHSKVAVIPDDGTSEVGSDEWNAAHALSGTLAATQMPALTGDVTTPGASLATTLATVNGNVGTFGSASALPILTVNAKGLVTAASSATTRETLTANRTYYVRTDGSDSNTGLVNNAGGAFLTIQKAVDTAQGIDFNQFSVTIQVAAGTYSGDVYIIGPTLNGFGALLILGDTATPANVVVSGQFYAYYAYVYIQGFRISASAGSLFADAVGWIDFKFVEFAGDSYCHIRVEQGGVVGARGAYSITGAAPAHVRGMCGNFTTLGITVTVSGTPAFSTAFAIASGGRLEFSNITFSGSATGVRYDASLNGVINTSGGGATFLPGNVGGATATGGVYA